MKHVFVSQWHCTKNVNSGSTTQWRSMPVKYEPNLIDMRSTIVFHNGWQFHARHSDRSLGPDMEECSKHEFAPWISVTQTMFQSNAIVRLRLTKSGIR